MPLVDLVPSTATKTIPLESTTFPTISNRYCIDNQGSINSINDTQPVTPPPEDAKIYGLYETNTNTLLVIGGETINTLALNNNIVKNIENVSRVEPFQDGFLCKETFTGLWKLIKTQEGSSDNASPADASPPNASPAPAVPSDAISVTVWNGQIIIGRESGAITTTKDDSPLCQNVGVPAKIKPLSGDLILACYTIDDDGQITTQARVYDKVSGFCMRWGGGQKAFQ